MAAPSNGTIEISDHGHLIQWIDNVHSVHALQQVAKTLAGKLWTATSDHERTLAALGEAQGEAAAAQTLVSHYRQEAFQATASAVSARASLLETQALHRAALSNASDSADAAHSNAAVMTLSTAELRNQLSQERALQQQLTSTVERLTDKLSKLKRKSQDDAQLLQAHESTIAGLRADLAVSNAELSTALSRAAKAQNGTTSAHAQADAAAERAQAALKAARDQHREELLVQQDRNTGLSRRVVELEDELAQAKQAADRMLTDLSSTASKLHMLADERDAAVAYADAATSEAASLQHRLSAAVTSTSAAHAYSEASAEEAKAAARAMQAAAEALAEARAERDQALVSAGKAQSTAAEARQEVADLTAALASAEAKRAEAESFLATLGIEPGEDASAAAVRMEEAALQVQVWTSRTKRAEARAAELQAALSEARSGAQTLSIALSEARNELAATQRQLDDARWTSITKSKQQLSQTLPAPAQSSMLYTHQEPAVQLEPAAGVFSTPQHGAGSQLHTPSRTAYNTASLYTSMDWGVPPASDTPVAGTVPAAKATPAAAPYSQTEYARPPVSAVSTPGRSLRMTGGVTDSAPRLGQPPSSRRRMSTVARQHVALRSSAGRSLQAQMSQA